VGFYLSVPTKTLYAPFLFPILDTFHPESYPLFYNPKYLRGGAVVEALRYKPEGRWINSRWCHWIFSLIILPVDL
jgi:hypothetical protein